jgi:hypothetical protein
MVIDPPISGFVGVVIVPDDDTIMKAYALASTLLPRDAEQRLAPGALPHITLTQCALRDASRSRVRALLAGIERRLHGLTVPLQRVTPFPGGFLFWCVDAECSARRLLQAAHEDALALAGGALDPVANAAVVEGTARATNDDTQLVANARRYGYAFVADRYLPHITLGFAPEAMPSFTPEEHAHPMTAVRVVLARLGRLGRVGEIVEV